MNKHWNEAMAQAGAARFRPGTMRAPRVHRMIATRPANFTSVNSSTSCGGRSRPHPRHSTMAGRWWRFALGLSIPPKYTAKAEITIDTGDLADCRTDHGTTTVIDTHINMLFLS